jgi:hypothetical protein
MSSRDGRGGKKERVVTSIKFIYLRYMITLLNNNMTHLSFKFNISNLKKKIVCVLEYSFKCGSLLFSLT